MVNIEYVFFIAKMFWCFIIYSLCSDPLKPFIFITLKIVVCSYRCHSANEYETHHTFNRKRSVSSLSMTPRRKNLPEESTGKESVTGLQ